METMVRQPCARDPMQILQKEIRNLQDEVATLQGCLEVAGILRVERFHADLHRRRFADVCRASRWSPQVAARAEAVLAEYGVAHTVSSASGAVAVCRLLAVCSSIGRSTQSILHSVTRTKIFVCGGNDGFRSLNCCEQFDPVLGLWEQLPPMSTTRSNAAAAMLEGRFYVCGGFGEDSQELNSCERFDPSGCRWLPCPPMISKRLGASAAVLNGRLYICGGHDGLECLRSAERFDASTDEWSMLPAMSASRLGAAVGVLASRLYVCGGSGDVPSLSSAERFDPTSHRWEKLPDMSERRWGAVVAVIANRIYLVGGHDAAISTVNSAECFDPFAHAWQRLPPMSARRAHAASAVLNQKLYVCGGNNGAETLFSVERFDPDRALWEQLSPMLGRRWISAAVALPNEIYVCGGHEGGDSSRHHIHHLRSFERFQPSQADANEGAHLDGQWEQLPPMSGSCGDVIAAIFVI